MMNFFIEEHKQLLRTLIQNHVSFLIIGGYAVIHYGYERTTGDLDIWLRLGNENKEKLLKALKTFSIQEEDLEELRKMDFTNPLPVFFIGQKPRRIDFVTMISNVSFEEAINKADYFLLENDLQIPVIHFNHLILSKSSTGRLKDLADIEELQRINKYRGKK
jgi:predicted nucleotidyltransferase